ncbi:MAG: sulfatase-like hydrolase/transferase [Gammaproteobacteria bacterium]|jgi:arylsulfatase A-like enzyme|nr:sulfatase-like hydrolase/transferase [Gammaproteobacteria bacterium]
MQFQSRSLIKLFFISVCLPLFLFPGFIFADSTPGLESVYGDLQKPPANVVLILFDWARRDAIGVYSEKDVSTPNIDKLAKRGVRFDNAYTTAVLCSPARASLITGTYPHAHGIRKTMYPAGINGGLPTMYQEAIANPFNDQRFSLAINFPKYITNSGFATAHIGKWHLGTGNPGFFDVFKSYNSLMPHWVNEPNKSAYREDIQTNEGIRFIQQNVDRPFFLYQSFYTPHAPFQPPQKYVDMYKNRSIDHKNYYAAVSSLDNNVGRIVKILEENKILDNTLIIISTDHGGSFQSRPGSYRGMGIAYDESARIPLIMHWPDRLPKNTIWKSGVSLVDIAPTILAATGINTKSRIMEIVTGREGSPFHGRDLISEIKSGVDGWPNPVFIQNLPEAAIENSWFDERAMRSENWKLVLRDFTADPRARKNAFFNIVSDPGEKTNLYSSKKHRKSLIQQLKLMLASAENLKDTLTIKLAKKELEILSKNEEYEYKLY